MNPSDLSARLGQKLKGLEADRHPAYCVRYDYAGQYALDESGAIIALNLRGMALAEDPGSWLAQLPRLRYLNLSECGLTELTLPELPELLVLNVSRNAELRAIQFPEEFPALLRAELSHCQLAAVRWPASPVLEFLNASRQEEGSLEVWSFATACARLYYLDLSHNQLPEFSLPQGFEQLGMLCLEQNQLKAVELSGELPKLESLRLSNNQLTTISSEWREQLPALQNLYLAENALSNDLRGFVEEENQHSIIAKLWNVLGDRAGGVSADLQCKVLLVGNGGVGKSNILNRLTGRAFNPDWDSTHGVRIDRKALGDYQVQYWDFGGQDIYHATHRLFMQSSAVYLVAWDAQTEQEPYSERPEPGGTFRYENFRLPYWLDYVRRTSRDYDSDTEHRSAPTIVVQTKKDEHGEQKREGVHGRYAEQFIYFDHDQAVASNQDDKLENGFAELELSIQKALRRAQPPGQQIADSWLTIRERVQSRPERSITREVFDREVLAGLDIKTDPGQILVNWLHKTGVVFYRPGFFSDQIILDQEWATGAVYTLFDRQNGYYREIEKARGRFTGEDLTRYWEKFELPEWELFVDFMLSCEMCYEEGGAATTSDSPRDFRARVFYAPQLMPEQPALPIKDIIGLAGPESTDWWYLRYHQDWLHSGVMRRFIVNTHRHAENRGIWRNGILLTDGQKGYALIEANRHTQAIHVQVTKSSKALLDKVRNLLADLQQKDQTGITYVSYDGTREVALADLHRHPSGNEKILATNGEPVDYEPFRPLLELNEQETFIEEIEDGGATRPVPGSIPEKRGRPEREDQSVISARKTGVSTGRTGKTLLMLSANPFGTELLRFKAETAKVDKQRLNGIAISVVNKLADIDRPTFFDAINRQKPHYLHFSGHGQRDTLAEELTALGLQQVDRTGVLLCQEQNSTQLLPIEAIVRWIRSARRTITWLELVVFNACDSSRIAQAVSALGVSAIGVSGEIDDTAAISFSEQLYNCLGRDDELPVAFSRAVDYAYADHDSALYYRLFQNGQEITG